MKFFKPEDFNLGADVGFVEVTSAALMANAKLERKGEKCFGSVISGGWQQDEDDRYHQTHKALLINIEPIVKCEHPVEKIKKASPHYLDGHLAHYYFFCDCGAKVKPKSFEVCE
jgi:hypothetical protein